MDGVTTGEVAMIQLVIRFLEWLSGEDTKPYIENMTFTKGGRRYYFDDTMARPREIGLATNQEPEQHDYTSDERFYRSDPGSMNNL
jgi:hypothetical protein